LAVFTFKKNKKGGGEDLASQVGDLDLDLDEDAMKLGLKSADIGGALGGGKMKMDVDPLAGITPKSDNKRIDTIDGTVTDIKNQLETMSLANKGMKGDVDKIKTEIDGINDSIKNLLCVYEAVSREYNPFVDSEMPSPKKADNPCKKEEACVPKPKAKVAEPAQEDLDLDLDLDSGSVQKIPDYIEAEPMDKILKPELNDEDDVASLVEKVKITKVTRPTRPQAPEKPAQIEKPTPVPPEPGMNVVVDFYSLNQIHKLVEHQLEQIYTLKLKGQTVSEEDYASLERWLAEYKRMGVK
jgi:hypothetical protein